MRAAIILLLLLPAAFSTLYAELPLANATAHNLALAPSLNDSYSPAIAVNGTLFMDLNGTGLNFSIISASVKLLTMEPSVDNEIPSASPILIFAWGSLAKPLAPADYAHDGCTVSQLSSSVSRSAVVNFILGNISYGVVTDSNVVPVPEAVVKAMANSSDTDVLQVKVNATFHFLYDVDNQVPGQFGCSDNPASFNAFMSVTDAMNWTVAGNRTLFFLRSPILGEQWFRDNHFDTVLFSDSIIYKGSITGPANQSYEFQLYEFNLTNDSYGAWHVVSVPLASGHGGIAGYDVVNTPTPLSHGNFTYTHLYEFNYSYEGLGENTLSVQAESVFGDNYSFQQELLSRTLSYSGNTTELGSPAGPSISRPSLAFSTDSIRTVTLSLGLVGVLLAVVLINRIRYK